MSFGALTLVSCASLLTFSLLLSEEFWLLLDFPSDRSIFSTFVGGYKNTAVAETREESPEILTNQ